MGWNPLKEVKKAVKSVTSAVGDLGTGLYKSAKDITDKTYEYTVEKTGLEKGAKEVGKGAENVIQETERFGKRAGKELERNKNLAAGVVLAPFTGGTSLIMAKDDDTTVGREVNKAWNEYGIKEGLTAAALVAGTIYTGGALAGAAGASVTGASALGSTAALTAVGTSAVQSGMQGRAAFKQAEATKEYQRQVDEANRKALEERKSSLLKTKKQLMPNLTKSAQGGVGGSSTEDITLQLG